MGLGLGLGLEAVRGGPGGRSAAAAWAGRLARRGHGLLRRERLSGAGRGGAWVVGRPVGGGAWGRGGGARVVGRGWWGVGGGAGGRPSGEQAARS